ncbi:MAG: GNAT family N-acetyltransferase [Bdellovibrio sp.]|nr:GNAT family N-acetyltransferase [Bdellovibrio sp.]
MDKLEFRIARIEDLPEIIALLAEDVVARVGEVVSDIPTPEYVRAFQEIEADVNNEIIVGTFLNKKVVAVLQLTYIPGLIMQGMKRAQVEGVRVSSTVRSRGIGKKLLTFAVERARERGCGIIQLTSNKVRTNAIRFYKTLGFEASHEGMKKAL